jgi:hypothetical protein
MHHEPLATNPLRTRADVQRAMRDLWKPLRPHFAREGAAVQLDSTEAYYGEPGRLLEAFVRPLWGIVPLHLGGGDFADWSLYVQGLSEGVDPLSPRYWGPASNNDQRFVEMAAIGVALALVPERLWSPLSSQAKANLVEWLSQINRFTCVPNNWLFFRVLANVGLRSVGAAWDRVQVNAALNQLDRFYTGEGWYTDGATPQRDYYIPWAMHFYALLYVRLNGEDDRSRAQNFVERARLLAPQFAAWFAPDGSSIPIGRSLTYRFAQGAFWGVLAYAGIEALPWSVTKGLYLRHLRWWLRQPCFTETGVLTIGYGYPNLGIAESYNAPGSPYWACKAFFPLALPESHPFWQAEERAHAVPEISVQAKAGLVVCRDEKRGHVFALSSNQTPFWPLRNAPQKYAKFAYSSAFGFSIQVGSVAPANGAGESMLMLADDDRDWRVRESFLEERYRGQTLYTRWAPWPDVQVETWLAPALPGHVRAHHVRAKRALRSYEGGFSISRVREQSNHVQSNGRAEIDYRSAFSAIRDLAGTRSGKVSLMEPNVNLQFPLTAMPGLVGMHEKGDFWLFSVVVGLPGGDQAQAGRAFLDSASFDARTPGAPLVKYDDKVVLECRA